MTGINVAFDDHPLAWKSDRRWLVSVVAVFGAIDLYTQWFEWLGATPTSVLIAGLGALALAMTLKSFNRQPIALG